MQFSVLQWNIWYQEDIHNVVALLKEYIPDIICLQELTLNYERQNYLNTPEFVAKELGYNYVSKEYPMAGEIMGANAIFTRFPITASRFAWTDRPDSSCGEGDEYRVYVEAELDLEAIPLTVGTTHMHYTHGFTDTPYKRRETTNLLTELKKHPNKFIFTGDLNAPPGSPTIEQVSKLLHNAGPDLSQNTWTTKPFSYSGFEEDTLNWRLDHIFATPDLRVGNTEIISTRYSDHLPVTVTLDYS